MFEEDERTRASSLRKIFLGSHVRAEREEKVLQYVIHRVNEGALLHDVVGDDYVRRNCSQAEVEKIVQDPELVHACRENLWRTFESGELDPVRGSHSGPGRLREQRRIGSAERRIGILMGERSKGPDRCEHLSLAEVELTEEGYRLRCVACGTAGPARKTPEAARKALRVLGARNGAAPRDAGD